MKRRIFKVISFALVMSFSLCTTLYATEHIELPGNDLAFVDKLNRRGISKEASSREVQGSGGRKPYLHSFRGDALGLGVDHSFHASRERIDSARVKHTRYRQMYKDIPIFAKELILHEDQSGRIVNVNGSIAKGIEQDLGPDVSLVASFSPAEALAQAKELLFRDTLSKRRHQSTSGPAPAPKTAGPASGRFTYRNEQSELNIYVGANNRPRLVYYMSFYAEPADGGEPTRPYLLIDAKTGEIVKRWEGLTHQAIGTGPGGNAKVGQYEYGTSHGYLDVLQNGTLCFMQNARVTTVNMTGMSDDFATPFSYACPRNTVKTVNDAYSPLNDAHYFGDVIVNMFTSWYGSPPIPLPLVMRTHYGINYENAFWDGQYMTFGDGYDTFFPLVSLDVAAHEVSHGFTEFNSGLIYEKESGGINESFSDMAGEAAEYFMRGSNDWQVGADIMKGSEALRYMDNPPLDGRSISDYADYTDSLDVHYSSGLFNKAFYLLATKPGWNTRKAFDVMVKANADYWTAASTFRSAACGAISAAADLSYSTTDVDSAFNSVNVYCGAPDIAMAVLPPAVAISDAFTFINTTNAFTQAFTASGGTPPYTWSVASGSLPSGLTLNGTTGEISGTPSASGLYRFTLQVADAPGRKNFISWTIVVDDALRTGWPRELQQRMGTGALPESYSPVMADLDGDGGDEIIVGDGKTLYVFSPDGTMSKTVLPGRVTTPVVADLDGDGLKEIIVSVQEYYSSSNSIYVFHSDLTPVTGFPAGAYATVNGGPGFVSSPVVADFNNDGQLKVAVVASPNNTNDPNYEKNVVIMVDGQGGMVPGWPKVFGPLLNAFDSPPAVGDIDRDGRKELVFAGRDGYVRVFRPDGTEFAQWQFAQTVLNAWSPVLADMDGDGFLEIVVKYHSSEPKTGITVLDRNGETLAGWPKVMSSNGSETPNGPIVADIDGDGLPEVVALSGAWWNQLNVLRGDGSSLPGWPVGIHSSFGSPIFDCYPVVADINGDGHQEVLVTSVDYSNNGELLAYADNGTLLPGFPKYASPASEIRSTAAIGDTDGNGKLDMVVKSENGYLFVWEMSQDGGFPLQWPMFRNDARHSGIWVPNRLKISPESLDFQSLLIGATSAPRSLSISNHRFENVTVSGMAITGMDSTSFSLAPGSCGNPPVTLAPMQSCTVDVSFTPASEGAREAVLSVTTAAPDMVPGQATLTGTGLLTTYTLTYTRTGSGSGTVTTSTGMTYTGSGSEAVPLGTVVLTAAPGEGSVFTGWEGACTGTGDCVVTIDGDKQVTAAFESSAAGVHQLTILRNGPGSSAITYTPGGACPSLCSHLYGAGTVVTLKPARSADAIFTGWSGCDTASGTSCTVTMTTAKTVTASYRSIPAVAAGDAHSVALKGDGTVWTWGDTSGLIGGTTLPVEVPGISAAVAIASLGWHAAVLKSDGTVWTWGSNIYGGLGDGSTTHRSMAGQVAGLSNMAAVATGFFHTVALREDGTVWTWGYNNAGQLGDGTTTDRLTPVQVPGFSGAVAVAAGAYYTVALKGDGTVWGWGDNSGGQLGDGSYIGRPNPVQVTGLSGVVAVSSGRAHTLALKSDGALLGWGHNYQGQLGDGTTVSRPQPVQVPGVSGVVSVGAGDYHSLVAGGDGTVKSWGYNNYGQLGDGTTAQHNSPAQVPGLSNVVAVDGGSSHSMALKGDGTIWTWGRNANAQLGDGTRTDHVTPAQVPNIKLFPAAIISGAPVSPTNSANATLTVGGAGIVAYKYKLDTGSYSAETSVAVQISLAGLGDGMHTISVIGRNATGTWQVTPAMAGWTVDLTPPATTAQPVGGSYDAPQNVTLSCTDSGSGCVGTWYCVGTGCNPTTPYTTEISVNESQILRFFSRDSAGYSEETQTATYVIVPISPLTTVTPWMGTYSDTQSVTLTCSNGSGSCATTYYCLGAGCTPTTVYSDPVSIASSTTLRFYSKNEMGNSEPVRSYDYTIDPTLAYRFERLWPQPVQPSYVTKSSRLAVDASGNVYVTGNPIQKFTSSGNFISTLGNGQLGTSGIAVDSAGNIYVADFLNFRIQKLDASGAFLTAWGTYGSGNGQIINPQGIAVDSTGYVYVSDAQNNRIQKFTSSGSFVTSWGTSGSGNGQFSYPSGIMADSAGYIYVVDNYNNRIQKFTSNGSFVTAWGTSGSGNGQFNNPKDIAVDPSGNIYVTDGNNNRIQKFTSSGAFVGAWGSYGKGNGQFSGPSGIAIDAENNVYVTDYDNRVQKLTLSGSFVTAWGSSGSDNGQFRDPIGVVVDTSGNVYVADSNNFRIQKFTSSGSFVTAWGSFGSGSGQFGGYPRGIAVDTSGNVYVADGGNNRIQKFNSSGTFMAAWGSSGSGNGQFNTPYDIAVDQAGNVFVIDSFNNRVQKFTSGGAFLTAWGSYGNGTGQFYNPSGIAVDSLGNVYVADTNNSRIQKFTSSGSFVAAWGSYGSSNGQFLYPRRVAVDTTGDVYVSDGRIQKFTPSGSFLTAWGSSGSGNGQFNAYGLSVDPTGNVYVADISNNRIQKFNLVTAPGAPANVTATAGNGQATVTFTAPASTGGSPITSYTVTSNPGNITATGTASPITVTGLTNSQAYTFTVTATNAAGTGAASVPSASIVPDGTAPVTTASPSGGTYNSAQNVTLFCTDNGGSGCAGTWYCVGNGCTPATSYSSAIVIAASTDLRFYSKDAAGNTEAVKVVTYVIDNSPPATSPSLAGGSYNTPQNVTLTCNDGAGSGCAATRYCLGTGCTPTTPYSAPVTIAASTDLRFYSSDVAGNSEAVQTATFTIVPAAVKVVADGQPDALYATLADALALAPAAPAKRLFCRSGDFTENITMNRCGEVVTISGGFDGEFAGITGNSRITGTLRVTCGKLVADGLTIR